MPHDGARHPLPSGFRWPDGVRAAALFSFDLDAEAVMLGDHPETAAYLDVMAHQRYGPKVAFISGRPARAAALERLIERASELDSVWLASGEELAAWVETLDLPPVLHEAPVIRP